MRLFFKIIGLALKKAAKATLRFICTPTGAAISMLGVVTVTSGVMLSAQLVEYAYIDEREFQLSSNLNTEFDLFSAEYKNALGEITVSGIDGDAVIAPGTSEEYTIRFRNTEDYAIDFLMAPKASFLSEVSVPIQFRLLDAEDHFIIGDAKNWVSVADMNADEDAEPIAKTLRAGESTEYFFQWKWDFEGDDEQDTSLGNQSGNVGVKVELAVQAEANPELGSIGGVPKDDTAEVVTSTITFFTLASASALLVVVMLVKRKNSIV